MYHPIKQTQNFKHTAHQTLANKHVKILSMLLDIRKMQIKIKWENTAYPLE